MDCTRASFIKLLWMKRRRESPSRACIARVLTRRWVHRTNWLTMKIRFGIERAALTIFLIFLSRVTFLKETGSLTLLESRTERVLTRWLFNLIFERIWIFMNFYMILDKLEKWLWFLLKLSRILSKIKRFDFLYF